MGLMLCMMEPIPQTGNIVTHGSSFCIAKGIVELHKVGVCGQALIKKHGMYSPVHVPGDHINNHFKDKEIGAVESLKSVVNGEHFYIHCQKEDNYITKIVSTHGTVQCVEDHKTYHTMGGERKECHCPESILGHNRAKH